MYDSTRVRTILATFKSRDALLAAIVDSLLNPFSGGAGAAYEQVIASQTDIMLGATGAVGDYLAGLLIVPETLNPGVVSIKDGNGSAMTLFVGGTGSVTTLHAWFAPWGAKCVAATTPGWKVTTGANVHIFGIGAFT